MVCFFFLKKVKKKLEYCVHRLYIIIVVLLVIQSVCKTFNVTNNRQALASDFLYLSYLSRYPDRDQLQSIYSSYLKPILHRQLSRHAVWSNTSKIHALAGSMVQLYEDVSYSIVLFQFFMTLTENCLITCVSSFEELV